MKFLRQFLKGFVFSFVCVMGFMFVMNLMSEAPVWQETLVTLVYSFVTGFLFGALFPEF